MSELFGNPEQLPEPLTTLRHSISNGHRIAVYTADQMRAFADAAETAAMQREAASWGGNAGMQAAEISRLRARILELEAVHEDASGAILQAVAAERERCAALVQANALACEPGSMLAVYLASNAAAIRSAP